MLVNNLLSVCNFVPSGKQTKMDFSFFFKSKTSLVLSLFQQFSLFFFFGVITEACCTSLPLFFPFVLNWCAISTHQLSRDCSETTNYCRGSLTPRLPCTTPKTSQRASPRPCCNEAGWEVDASRHWVGPPRPIHILFSATTSSKTGLTNRNSL